VIVVDASAVLEVLVGEPNESLATRLASEDVLHAPHLLDTEVLHVLRRLERRRDLSRSQVDFARRQFGALVIDRYPHQPLTERVWELRLSLSAYDATYASLAEVLDATLVTTDRRLAGANGIRAAIEVH
jgi:predicted nucleic acid-binding protein